MFPNQTERCPFCNSETCSRKPVIGMHSRSEECFNRQIALLKSELHDLKAENERMSRDIHRLQVEYDSLWDSAATYRTTIAQQAAKIAELEQAALLNEKGS